jgi:hypothetical protein
MSLNLRLEEPPVFQFLKSLFAETVAQPKKAQLQLTFMEGRTTPAVLGSGHLTEVPHHHAAEVRGQEAEVRHGADDAANHERIGDRRGGMRPATANLIGRNGADDPANHNIGDDQGGNRGGRRNDDPAGHR